MSKIQDREDIVKKIYAAAQKYKESLVGKRFLYVFDGRYIEVIYKAQNFRHLTGVETRLSANRFYYNATHNSLQANQIYFSKAHPYRLCLKKIKHIEEVTELASSENFILEEIKTNSQIYKFGTTDLKFTLCLNEDLDDTGKAKSECYIVQSLRDEDCFLKSKNVYEVTHIFSRTNDQKKYTDLLFMDSKVTLEDLPNSIKDMLAEELLSGGQKPKTE